MLTLVPYQSDMKQKTTPIATGTTTEDQYENELAEAIALSLSGAHVKKCMPMLFLQNVVKNYQRKS